MGRSDFESVPSFLESKGELSPNHYKLPWFDVGFQIWEPFAPGLFKAVWTEFVCTMMLVYLATGVVVFGCHSTDTSTSATPASGGATAKPVDCFLNQSRVLTIATGFGMSVFVLVYVASAFSGGHLNPAVTLAFVLTKKITVVRAGLYWIVQMAGAVSGSAFVFLTDRVGYKAAKGGANRLLEGYPSSGGWLLECILTFMLVFVIFAATDTNRAQSTAHLPILAPLAIGFVVFADHLAAVAIDGCSINPARSFGPAVVGSNWQNHWIFWVGPLSGAVIAVVFYELSFRPSHDPILPIDREDQAEEGGIKAHKGNAQHNGPVRMPGYAGVQGLATALPNPSDDSTQPSCHAPDKHDSHGTARPRRDTAQQDLLQSFATDSDALDEEEYMPRRPIESKSHIANAMGRSPKQANGHGHGNK